VNCTTAEDPDTSGGPFLGQGVLYQAATVTTGTVDAPRVRFA
jgi:hypothetical protein